MSEDDFKNESIKNLAAAYLDLIKTGSKFKRLVLEYVTDYNAEDAVADQRFKINLELFEMEKRKS